MRRPRTPAAPALAQPPSLARCRALLADPAAMTPARPAPEAMTDALVEPMAEDMVKALTAPEQAYTGRRATRLGLST